MDAIAEAACSTVLETMSVVSLPVRERPQFMLLQKSYSFNQSGNLFGIFPI